MLRITGVVIYPLGPFEAAAASAAALMQRELFGVGCFLNALTRLSQFSVGAIVTR